MKRLLRHLSLIVLAFAGFWFGLGWLAHAAWGHGDAMWIETGGYKDQDAVKCCGPTDCRPEPAAFFRETDAGIVVLTAGGREVLMRRDLVGRGLYPSIDDRWWICVRDGQVKCVFKPTTGG